MQFGQFGRREFIKLVGGAVVAGPGAALAQTPGRLWKIGVLANESWPPLEGLRDGLRDLGYVEGKTHLFVYRFAEGNAERFPALASELVNLPVDVIVSWGTPASLAAHTATDTIPIVMSAGDPIGAGIVAGLARPGGNITGMSVQMAEQEGKRLELLKKLLPSFSRVAVLSNPSNPYCAIAVGEARRRGGGIGAAARPRGSIGPARPRGGVPEPEPPASRCRAGRGRSVFGGRADPHRGRNDQEQAAVDLLLPRARAGGRADDLHHQLLRRVPSTGNVHRQDLQGRRARRSAGPAADQVRADDQSQDCEGARA